MRATPEAELTDEQQLRLFYQMKDAKLRINGANSRGEQDEEAEEVLTTIKGTLVKNIQPYVGRLARIYANMDSRLGLTPEDLQQHGNIGYLEALEKFDPELGIPILGYAHFRII